MPQRYVLPGSNVIPFNQIHRQNSRRNSRFFSPSVRVRRHQLMMATHLCRLMKWLRLSVIVLLLHLYSPPRPVVCCLIYTKHLSIFVAQLYQTLLKEEMLSDAFDYLLVLMRPRRGRHRSMYIAVCDDGEGDVVRGEYVLSTNARYSVQFDAVMMEHISTMRAQLAAGAGRTRSACWTTISSFRLSGGARSHVLEIQ
jgi:hypothetical protein